MLHIVYIQEDQTIVADLLNSGEATVTVQDGMTGKSKTVSCEVKELAAAFALAIGSDEMDAAETLYPLAEKLMEKLVLEKGDNTLRFIP